MRALWKHVKDKEIREQVLYLIALLGAIASVAIWLFDRSDVGAAPSKPSVINHSPNGLAGATISGPVTINNTNNSYSNLREGASPETQSTGTQSTGLDENPMEKKSRSEFSLPPRPQLDTPAIAQGDQSGQPSDSAHTIHYVNISSSSDDLATQKALGYLKLDLTKANLNPVDDTSAPVEVQLQVVKLGWVTKSSEVYSGQASAMVRGMLRGPALNAAAPICAFSHSDGHNQNDEQNNALAIAVKTLSDRVSSIIYQKNLIGSSNFCE